MLNMSPTVNNPVSGRDPGDQRRFAEDIPWDHRNGTAECGRGLAAGPPLRSYLC
jgi:hypothetical protein